jgi:hypothetical protein
MKREHKNEKRQIDEFRKAARELGCDESEERFQKARRTKCKKNKAERCK